MKKFLLSLLLCVTTTYSFSQAIFGFDGGLGKTTSYKSYLTPELQAYVLGRISPHIYAGGAVGFERFSFLYNANVAPVASNFGDIISIRHKSSYFFFYPKLDIGLGYRKYVHINLSVGGGIYMGGSEFTNRYAQIFTTPSAVSFRSDTAGFNTTYNTPTLMLQYGLGVSERLPTEGYWNIIISQNFGYLPKAFDKTESGLKTNYISLSVGIMHNNQRVLVDY